MGGKTKHTPRTKNNAKPSSSSRSAELLGSTPNFVGFSAHSDLGLVPLAPGFTATEQISETLESSIPPEFQLILKKTTKKDPMTKKKAVQEFIALINQSDLKEIKAILPFWPKFYQNLANDPNYSIRELAQTTLQLLVSKCKKAVAPFLKQLVPVWVASQFDNYAPAASTASASFAETFVHNNDRTCEVLLHCKDEIMGYVTQNLTYHTMATLSGKNLSVEEAEQKYHRVVIWSLKELSFFVEHTANCKEVNQIQDKLGKLLSHQKFWSYTKSTLNPIRAAIFEFMYNLLVYHKELINPHKGQLIMVTFQKIDEFDSLVVPHIWGCILLLQVNFPDWYQIIGFQKVVWPKFCSLVRKNFNGNAPAICPHILPFFSQLSQVNLSTEKYHNLIKEFFDNFKSIITADTPNMSKSHYAAIVKTYYECLRYFMQKFINELKDERENNHDILLKLMEENVIDLLKLCLKGKNTISVKQCFLHTSALIAFLDRQKLSSKYYENLLSMFWHNLHEVTSETIGVMSDVDELVLKNLIELISDLHAATPILEEHKVTFIKDLGGKDCNEGIRTDEKVKVNTSSIPKYSCDAAAFVNKELKGIAVRLFKTCLQKILHLGNSEFIKYIRPITVMFNDEHFFCEITEEGSLEAALTYMYKILQLFVEVDNTDYEVTLEVMEVIFQILQHQDKSKRFKFIEQPLIQLSHRDTHVVLLERLLSHPWCAEPEVRVILSQPEIKRLISELVYDGVQNNSKDLYSILHKCFNQMDNGDILIHSDTVTDILGHLSDVLLSPPVAGAIDLDGCASFLSLIFPVVCDKHNKYCSQAIQNKAFLSLFKTQLLNCSVNNITPGTILEVMTCWQHALSDGFTLTDDLLNACAECLKELLQQENLTCQLIHEYANIVAKLVLYSRQHITDDNEHLGNIDGMLKVLLAFDVQAAEDLMNTSLFVECINSLATPCRNFAPISCSITQMEKTFKIALFNFTTLKLLLQSDVKDGDTDEKKPCLPRISKLSNYVTNELLQYIQLAAAAECFINCIEEWDDPFKCLMNDLCAAVRDLFQNIRELGTQLKESLLTHFCDRCYNYAGCLYLQYTDQYSAFDENALLLLFEELQERFLDGNHVEAYVHMLQRFLTKLEARTITMQSSIMRTEPQEIWLKAVVYRCLIENCSRASSNDLSDKHIIMSAVQFVTEHSDKLHSQKELLSYQCIIPDAKMTHVINAVEYMNLLMTMLKCNPYELTLKNWDVIRVGLGHWILSLVKSMDLALLTIDQKTFYFAAHVFKLFAAVTQFFTEEKQKSSTELIQNVYDEWIHVFYHNSYISLFKQFYRLCEFQDIPKEFTCCWHLFLSEIAKTLQNADNSVLYTFCKTSTTITLDHICNFLLKNLSHSMHSLRILSVYMLKQLTMNFVSDDLEVINKQNEQLEKEQQEPGKWHFLSRFQDYITRYEALIYKYNKEFSFKLLEISEMIAIDPQEALPYLMLWDCIIHACAKAPVALRSVYTTWLHENKYEENLLHFLFRALPEGILKNYNTRQMNKNTFTSLNWTQLKDGNFTIERYACHLYREILSKLPALVRKWWNESSARQKAFVDTLTANFVSPIICHEELMSIAGKKEKHDNMQITVHTSTREVLAVYSIDEVRMELVITLAVNYPLGAVKVECNKQIGGRASSRHIAMQLTIFLTHQNGTILDGLAMWKNNLDKKFEGIEECFVCYTVIHQDTCQLPKLTCKTCKKKFHGPCLYKWFTTSNKSTCPICRNVF